MKNHTVKFLATGAYSGLSPVMPGTIGTLVAVPLAYALSLLNSIAGSAAVIIIIAFAVYVAGMAEDALGRKDPPSVVIDEIAGFVVAMWLFPFTLFNVISAFLLFRFFDIVKPWPIRLIEKRLPGGFGVVMDDVAAGVMANVVLVIISRVVM